MSGQRRATAVGKDARWDAVLKRDRAADGTFYYSVATTGVYCRPSCASRRARRENVAFHASVAEAEAAGFRACKRCRPNQASDDARMVELVANACRLVESSEDAPDLERLAKSAGLSRFHFHRLFTRTVGVTPKAYVGMKRAERVRRQLREGGTVTSAFLAARFNSSSRFYAGANEAMGMTPTTYRRGGPGVEIRFAVGECSLGSILVAATAKGVCAISLGDDPARLVRELEDDFGQACLIGADDRFERLIAQVIAVADGIEPFKSLPLDIRATAFQGRVWQALREIPAGETTSYGEIARRIGRPGAARAVARACASNRVAVIIPCHRVIAQDGSLSGYRWGVERKAELLRRERESSRD